LFFAQTKEYQQSVIPTNAKIIGLTAGLPSALMPLVGAEGKVFGLDHFGYSAPAGVLDDKFGFTPSKVCGFILSNL